MPGNLSIANHLRVATLGATLVAVLVAALSCDRPRARANAGASDAPDEMGSLPRDISVIAVRGSPSLVENSGLAMSLDQPGVMFSINDSNNGTMLFAVDTTGMGRGTWRVHHATNIDWEAVAIGPCGGAALGRCIYIGDIGDNQAAYSSRTIYRAPEPRVGDSTFTDSIAPDSVTFTYPDQAHDVEAMYVAPNGDAFLITKRPLRVFNVRLRPALVFRIPASAWGSGSAVVAELVDSLSIVPGSAPFRTVTDASLAPDGRHLAVRTYSQVFIYATDPATGRVKHDVPEGVCYVVSLGESGGEGVTWVNASGRLVLSSEGRKSPLHLVSCPLPH